MRVEKKRLLSAVLAASMLAGVGGGMPFAGAVGEGNRTIDLTVYDNVVTRHDADFADGIRFADGEAQFAPKAANFVGEEWYDQSATIGINRERSKAQFVPYQDTATALASEKSVLDSAGPEKSDYYKLLSGKDWDFALVKTPAEAALVDDQYLAESYSGNAFQPEHVPQAWQTYKNDDGTFKYFDEPMYTNHPLPWFDNFESENYNKAIAPVKYNPVGYYRTEFDTPANWDGRETFISFQSVESAYYLYINGKKVGYSTDSFTAHDFNITPYLKPAGQKNTLALKVHRWSIGSWLENQDFIRESGIYRDVYLYSKDEVEIRDMFIKTKFNDRTSIDSDVTMTVETDVRGLRNTAGDYTVSVKLYNTAGEVVASADDATASVAAAQSKTMADKLADKGTRVTSTLEVTNPAKWFPDTPNLYSVAIELKDAAGNVLESTVQRHGFREVYNAPINEQGQHQMQITGQKIMLRGTNRHDTDLDTGHALTKQDIFEDLALMKSHNINSIRTSHYPNDDYLYALADEMGLYICAEANIESHRAATSGIQVPSGASGSNGMPEWVASVLDRNANNLERNKNHSSVIIWSLGNEATYSTPNLSATYGFWVASMYLLNRDADRFRKYERENIYGYQANKDMWSVEVRKGGMVDVHSTQYWLPNNVNNYAANSNNKLPYIHSEYNHAMGQSYGNAKEHWESIRNNDNVNGGFIWDWIDQSIQTTSDGDTFWGYGGDWIDAKRNDNAFCGNGMAYADRTASPKLVEGKKVHQQINFYQEGDPILGESMEIRVINELENTSLDAFDITWKLTEDSTTVLGEGSISLTTPPMHSMSVAGGSNEEVIDVPIPNFTPAEGKDYLLDFSVKHKTATAYAAVGEELAYEQFQLLFDDVTAQPKMDIDAMQPFGSVTEDGEETIVSGKTAEGQTFEITLNTRLGTIDRYKLDGKTVMKAGPETSIYRAQTYNDTASGNVGYNQNWFNAGNPSSLKNLRASVTKDESGKKITLGMNANMRVDAKTAMSYEIYSNGEIVVLNQFIPNSNFASKGLPKLGTRMIISGDYSNINYYGRGPDENYVDRNSGSRIGLYSSTVDKQFDMKMLKPQENGNRSDVRWTSLTNDAGVGLMVSAQDTVETSALHYTAEELNASAYDNADYRHPSEVPQRNDVVWSIDYRQNGVADTAFMGHAPYASDYRVLTNQSYTYSYRISPIVAATDKMAASNVKVEATAAEFPISAIYINGQKLSGFDMKKYSYDVQIGFEDGLQITADSIGAYDVQIDDGVATVSAVGSKGEDVVYELNLSRGMPMANAVHATAFSSANAGNEGPVTHVLDGNPATFWHSSYAPAAATDPVYKIENLWFTLELEQPTLVDGVQYYGRPSGNNGKFLKHNVYVSDDDTNWVLAGTGEWDSALEWKTTTFEPVMAKYVRVYPITVAADSSGKMFGSCAEARVLASVSLDGVTAVFDQETYTYAGQPLTPDPKVELNGVRLVRGLDYKVTYENNEAAGIASAIITPMGLFANAEPITASFNIEQAPQYAVTVDGGTADKAMAYEGDTITVTAQSRDGYRFTIWEVTGVTLDSNTAAVTSFEMPANDVSLVADFRKNSSGGGGGGGGTTEPTQPGGSTTTEVTKPDGSKETTVVNKDTGETTVTTKAPDGSESTVKTDKDGKITATVTLSAKTEDKAVLPMPEIKPSTDAATAPSVTIKADKPMTVTIPVTDQSKSVVAIMVGADGKETILPKAVMGENGLQVSIDQNATIKLVDNKKSFGDVASSNWAASAVDFVSSRELFTGTSATSFSPNAKMTRGMLVTVLWRFESKPAGGTANFGDVGADAYYADAVAWASSKNIVAGTGNGFSPDGDITREALAAILYRYAGSPAEEGKLDAFADGSKVSDWAQTAMAWATQQGIISGKNGSALAPQDSATRAEVATMIQRFAEKLG